jgi:hypothetical protein
MVFSRKSREHLSEVDSRWPVKIAFRMLFNTICAVSTALAVYTILQKSRFNPSPYQGARSVLVAIPCNGLTIFWNTVNMLHFLTRKRPFSGASNTLFHFFVGTAFAIVGIYVTVTTRHAFDLLKTNPYGVPATGSIVVTTSAGKPIFVNVLNVGQCPAFSSCKAQAAWMRTAHLRAVFSVASAVLFDVGLYDTSLVSVGADENSGFHFIFFLWCCNDTVFGLRGKTERRKAREERDRRREWEKSQIPPGTANSDKEFDVTAKPTSSDGKKPRVISGPIHVEHTTYELSDSTQSFISRSVPSLVLAPSAHSRESLSLSIYQNPVTRDSRPISVYSQSVLAASRPGSTHSLSSQNSRASHVPESGTLVPPKVRRLSTAPVTSRLSTTPDVRRYSGVQAVHRTSNPPPALPRASVQSVPVQDYSQQPHPRYSYFRGAPWGSTPSLHASETQPAESAELAELPGIPKQSTSTPDLRTYETPVPPPATRWDARRSSAQQTSPKRKSRLRHVVTNEEVQ